MNRRKRNKKADKIRADKKRKRKRKHTNLQRFNELTLTGLRGRYRPLKLMLSFVFLHLFVHQISSDSSPMSTTSLAFNESSLKTATVQQQLSIQLLPQASKCLFVESIHKKQLHNPINSSKLIGQVVWAPNYFNQLIETSENTVISRFNLNPASNESLLSSQADQIEANLMANSKALDFDKLAKMRPNQLSFESICSGWKNIQLLQTPNRTANQHPPAFWCYDTRRQALVAKFIFYDKSQYHDVTSRIALLTSPRFPPIPAYHSRPESRYYSSCKLSFASYMTMASHLELNLVLPPVTNHKLNNMKISNETSKATHQIHPVMTIMEGKLAKGRQVAEKQGEDSVWLHQTAVIPPGLPANLPYRLEFSAMSSFMTSDNIASKKFLIGVAIKNISLSPQCFGLGIDAEHTEQLKSSGYLNATYWLGIDTQSASSDSNTNRSQQDKNINFLLSILDSHRFHITIACALMIFILISCSLHSLFCWKIMGSQHPDKFNSRNKLPLFPQWLQFCFCYSCPCCLLVLLLADRKRRYRIYESEKEMNETPLKFKGDSESRLRSRSRKEQVNKDLLENHQRESNESLVKSLFPLQHMLDDVELNDNPQYKCSLLASALSQPNPLGAYEIDKNRLTLTRLLGKGAFGQVYQGYLVCYNSGDTEEPDNLSDGPDEDADLYLKSDREIRRLRQLEYGDYTSSKDQLESHSIPVAVKVLTENGLKKVDFILEATSMSMVSHRNIVGFIGVCFGDGPKYIIMEYLAGGNLKNFLIKNRRFLPQSQIRPPSMHSPSSLAVGGSNSLAKHEQIIWTSQPNLNSAPTNSNQKRADGSMLNVGDLLVIALDIARACDYLQKRKIIHRDLAARNCLLTSATKRSPAKRQNRSFGASSPTTTERSFSGAKFLSTFSGSHSSNVNRAPSALQVEANHHVDLSRLYLNGFEESGIVAKLADFGMTREIEQQSDYYRTTRREMPVRWMPPESLNGVVTNKSDVWSFGILLWELFSLAQLPYQDIPDNNQVYRWIRSRQQFDPGTKSVNEANLTDEQDTSSETKVDKRHLLLTISDGDERPLVEQGDSGSSKDDPIHTTTTIRNGQLNLVVLPPPLPPPHCDTPHPIYSIMCSCWATNPNDRPKFEEIANRLYWCLQMPEVLQAPLPTFAQSTKNLRVSHQQQQSKTQAHQGSQSSFSPARNQANDATAKNGPVD